MDGIVFPKQLQIRSSQQVQIERTHISAPLNKRVVSADTKLWWYAEGTRPGWLAAWPSLPGMLATFAPRWIMNYAITYSMRAFRKSSS